MAGPGGTVRRTARPVQLLLRRTSESGRQRLAFADPLVSIVLGYAFHVIVAGPPPSVAEHPIDAYDLNAKFRV